MAMAVLTRSFRSETRIKSRDKSKNSWTRIDSWDDMEEHARSNALEWHALRKYTDYLTLQLSSKTRSIKIKSRLENQPNTLLARLEMSRKN